MANDGSPSPERAAAKTACVFYAVGWVALALVTVVFVAAMISTSTDEHAAPVLGVFVIFGLFLIVAGDVVAQGLLAAARTTWPRLRQR
jgi:hypothetical protein